MARGETELTPTFPSEFSWEFLFYNEDITSQDYTQTQPLWYFASGPGMVFRRSSWATNATYWGIWAGPLEESHQNLDVNGFTIFKGTWLAGNASLYSASGVWQYTADQNNLTFGGFGQALQIGVGNLERPLAPFREADGIAGGRHNTTV